MPKPKYSNETLLQFIQGKLHNPSLTMQILSDVIDGDKELEARIDTYIQTRKITAKNGNTLLLNALKHK